jgi:hypothetical protein
MREALMDRGAGSTVISYAAPEDSLPRQAMIRLFERLGGSRRIARAYQEMREGMQSGEDVWALAVRSLGITVRYCAERLAAVPRCEPLVVVAIVELTDEAGHILHVAFNGSDVKNLIGWRLLMGL